MILDRNANFAKVLGLHLESFSIFVSIYQNALEVLATIKYHLFFHVVFVDVNFPSFNTCQLTIEIQSLKMIKPLPVVGLVYRKNNSFLDKLCSCFATSLFKPINYSQLIDTLK